MSWSITAIPRSWPVPASAWAALATPDLRWRPGPPEGAWSGAPIEVWRDGVSTRAIKFERDGEALVGTIHAAACPEDWELAIRTVELLVPEGDAAIDLELMGRITRGELRARLDPEKLRGLAESGANSLQRFLQERGQEVGAICVPGPVRGYHIGPRRLAALTTAGPEDKFSARLFDDIRRVQYGPDTRGRQDAGLFHVEKPDGKKGSGLAFWTRGHPIIVPGGADALVIEDTGAAREMLTVVRDDIPMVAGRLFAGWLDETSALLNDGDETTWAGVLERAREADRGADSLKRVTDVPTASPSRTPQPRRPWWRFW